MSVDTARDTARDAARLRYLADAVTTATPAQRIVMLYDRLGQDIERATTANEIDGRLASTKHLLHAQQIVAELRSSLQTSSWSGAENLASLYGFLLHELVAVNISADLTRLRAAGQIVTDLRSAWCEAAQQLTADSVTSDRAPVVTAGAGSAWVG